ncbi:MAG: hypothetical protein HFJ10_09630 [Lachnospiraceae bacterium]|nr:hypothetical protein [Lachnospiraceae bacterium]
MKYELKKVFLRTSSRVALCVLLAVMGITCFFVTRISYVDENGDSTAGPAAIASLKSVQDAEKEYLIRQYKALKTPFFYDYTCGWQQLFDYSPTIIMLIMLVLGYLVAGIFSNEFSLKSDAILFTSLYGRDRAILAKICSSLFYVCWYPPRQNRLYWLLWFLLS